MFPVVAKLLLPAPVGLIQGLSHGLRHPIGVEYGPAAQVASGSPDGLNERIAGPQKAFLVGIQDGDQRHFRKVEPLAQQVDSHQHVEISQPQASQDLDPLQRIDLRMHVAAADAHLSVVFGQILGHALGQGGHQHSFPPFFPQSNLVKQIVHLGPDGPHLHRGIHQPGGANDLFHHNATGLGQLVGPGSGRDIDRLIEAAFEFLELERTVVQGRGQAKTEVDQVLLAGTVPGIHPSNLGDGLMTLVDEEQVVLRQVIQQGWWRLAGAAARKMAGVILNAVTESDFLHHLQVEQGPLLKTLGLHPLPLGFQPGTPLFQLLPDGLNGLEQGGTGHDVVGLGVDGKALVREADFAAERVDLKQGLDFIPEQLDAVGLIVVSRKDLDAVPPDTESAPAKIVIAALILDLHQLLQYLLPADPLSLGQKEQHPVVGFRRTDAVDAADAGHNDAIPPFEQGSGGRHAHLVDLVVDGGFFLDIGVGSRNVGFGLIVVVVADEVLHGIVREKAAELLAELRRQRLVVSQHQSRAVHLLYDLGHGVGLAGTGDPQQNLVRLTVIQSANQFPDRLDLIALRLILSHPKGFLRFHRCRSTRTKSLQPECITPEMNSRGARTIGSRPGTPTAKCCRRLRGSTLAPTLSMGLRPRLPAAAATPLYRDSP